ncbi:MAG: hypothetical protein ACKOS8_09505 [Gemmataceae bacterium]
MKNILRFCGVFGLIGAMAVLGCAGGNPNAPANFSGKVTYKGQPVGGGTVKLEKDGPAEGSRASINLNPDGSFNGTDLAEGDFAVTIETDSAKGNTPTTYGANKGKKMASSPVPQTANVVKATYTEIPKKYGKKESSGLKVTLKRGKNEQNFDLTD